MFNSDFLSKLRYYRAKEVKTWIRLTETVHRLESLETAPICSHYTRKHFNGPYVAHLHIYYHSISQTPKLNCMQSYGNRVC